MDTGVKSAKATPSKVRKARREESKNTLPLKTWEESFIKQQKDRQSRSNMKEKYRMMKTLKNVIEFGIVKN